MIRLLYWHSSSDNDHINYRSYPAGSYPYTIRAIVLLCCCDLGPPHHTPVNLGNRRIMVRTTDELNHFNNAFD